MATVILDKYQEYIWQVDGRKLDKVLEYVMRHVDSTSAFHDLLYSSKTYGNLEFFQLGETQQQIFQEQVTAFHTELRSKLESFSNESPEYESLTEDLKIVDQLLSMLSFAKANDLSATVS